MPKQIVSKSTYGVLFRAFSKEQDNYDLSRYIFYSSIKLIVLYTAPVFIGLWWIAEPFIYVVYGEKWMGSVPIIKLLMLMGIARCVGNVAGSVIEAQNCLGKEFFIFVQSLALLTVGCLLFTENGIEYVAVIVLIRTAYATGRIVSFACRLIGASIRQVIRSAAPGLVFSLIMVLGLYLEDVLFLKSIRNSSASLYLVLVVASGILLYVGQFMLLPVPSISSEVDKWKRKIRGLWAVRAVNA
jgi:O-antigen/teichoic acid export membrane protein